MAESSKIGQAHAIPDGELEIPAGKRAKVGRNLRNDSAKTFRKRRDRVKALPEPCSPGDVLWRDVVALLGIDVVNEAIESKTEFDSPLQFHQEVEVDVSCLLPSGEGIAYWTENSRPWAVIVPFSLPGERVRVRIYRNARLHSYSDLLQVLTPNSTLREMNLVKCRYFGSCAGCQFQMLSYDKQLDFKRDTVVKAYSNFSDLPETSIPPILSTVGSPLQYGYRTKLTPHFEAPPKSAKKQAQGDKTGKPEWLKIGFNKMGTTKTMDIEDCPIATTVINETIGPIRDDIIKNINTYKKGVSLLFRDSINITSAKSESSSDNELNAELRNHVCITDHKGTVREKVGDWIFEYIAGSFFQNNNSVLEPLTHYVRDSIFSPTSSTPENNLVEKPTLRPTHLVDAYCGAGLFAVTLSPYFNIIAGIELSTESIKCATKNAFLNNISPARITFRAGDAADIFASVADFPPEKTVLIVDPPRKGCDDKFIEQLVNFRCGIVVYVSCNVHTQARDVGKIVSMTESDGEGRKYRLESVRGFDLFPQTAHVESVAVLRLT